MNNLKIKQAQQKSLRRAKAEVARLTDELNVARFWHDIAEVGIVKPKQVEKVKNRAYKRVKYAVIAISIAVILFMLFGCSVARESLHLVGAVGEDVGWIANKAADNIQTEK